MELLTEIPVRKTNHSRIHEADFKHLEFGKYVSDHMLVCNYASRSAKTSFFRFHNRVSQNFSIYFNKTQNKKDETILQIACSKFLLI